MSYTYTDSSNARLEIKMPHPSGFIIGLEGDTGEYVNIVVRNEDAPRVALETLKAAGIDMDHESVGLSMAARHLRDVVSLGEARKKAGARDKRRDELAQELAEDGAYAYRFAGPDLQAAIDRIIELESRA